MSEEVNQELGNFSGNNVKSVDKDENYFLENINFQKLMGIREEIYQATQVKPSVKKLVNFLIQESELMKIFDQLIKQYS